MPRTAPAAVRLVLVERAAQMLARREPVTLRALVEGTGASTMAVYTHFGGMPGLWRAVRQEGFTRLAARLDQVRPTSDPVRDLAALGAAYVDNALSNPALYRTMYDAVAELDDPQAAAAAFGVLVAGAARARERGRFADAGDPEAVATQMWAAGHGLTMLVITGVLPREALMVHAPAILTALFVGAGDDEDRCRRSVRAGWSARLRSP
ncbi:TetR-like C-terminal domain-containing protein [Micromonospora sp. NBRC 101691]|uniref:TetR/AcrR family transcriptional regulator n=1 Tax=Micromonospora sp. NBRC 101691 TaxID=3032198 RepID=UPI0025530D19|nr:TetR-like C-terminal domain-containing protein [Micromonospora sp. NBRC 101691]